MLDTKIKSSRPWTVLLSEAAGGLSRHTVKIGPDQAISPGSVLGAIADTAKVVARAAPGAENAGDASILLETPATRSDVWNGLYRGVCESATSVRWKDPDGVDIGISTHGEVFEGPISFTISAGSIPSEPGDIFQIVVSADLSLYDFVALDPSTTNGGQIARAIALDEMLTAPAWTSSIVAIVRQAEVKSAELIWPDAITADDKRSGIEDLARRSIIVR